MEKFKREVHRWSNATLRNLFKKRVRFYAVKNIRYRKTHCVAAARFFYRGVHAVCYLPKLFIIVAKQE